MVQMREICGFTRGHPFTVKWVDEEGDLCTISSQWEVDEAIRLYEANKEAELTVHGKTQHFVFSRRHTLYNTADNERE